MPAKDIWNLIIENQIKCAEPGLLNETNLFKNNSWYFDPIECCNPCITGETLISLADGREDISIRQLAEEGKDVPVFCLNKESGSIEVQMMRNPRITGYNQKILKITLDDGSFIRCTENHKFYMKDGTEKEAKGLLVNDRLHHMTKTYLGDVLLVNGLKGRECRQHRLVGEFKIGRYLNENEIVHHIDGNHYNDKLDNIGIMTQSDHDRIHQLGDNNVMRDKWWNKHCLR